MDKVGSNTVVIKAQRKGHGRTCDLNSHSYIIIKSVGFVLDERDEIIAARGRVERM